MRITRKMFTKTLIGILSLLACLVALGCQSAARAPQKATPAASSESAFSNSEKIRPEKIRPEKTMPERMLTNFTSSDEAQRWQIIDDTVMGGISQGEMQIDTAQGTGIFAGTLSLENNGGFSSVRRDSRDYDFSGTASISTRVKGDGRRYQLRVQTYDANNVTYRAKFKTTADEWQTVTVPLADFEPVFRGRIVEAAPPVSAEEIYQVGFLIADKKSGSFSLEVDWIAVR